MWIKEKRGLKCFFLDLLSLTIPFGHLIYKCALPGKFIMACWKNKVEYIFTKWLAVTNWSIVVRKSVALVCSLFLPRSKRSRRRHGNIDGHNYERICLSLLNECSQIAMESGTLSSICFAIRKFGKTLSSPYRIMNWSGSSHLLSGIFAWVSCK